MKIRRNLQALGITALVFAAQEAASADYRPYGTPVLGRNYYWQGPYFGANLGYQWGSVNNAGGNPSGVTGGIQAGHNWQIGDFVFGGEIDLQISDANDQFAGWKFSNPWFGTLRARAGLAMSSLLFYGTVGFAYGGLRTEAVASGVSESRLSYGWTAGAGVEGTITGPWSAKAEYLYVDLNDRAYSLTGANHGIGSSVLRLGVNYRF
jgi:outer membrane immunogenic protein